MRKGFTLLEMVIAMSIMAILTLFTAQSINKAIRSREKVQNEIRHTSHMRDVLRIIERDVNLAFHYRNIHYEVLKKIQDEQKSSATPPGQPGQPGQPDPTGGQPPAAPQTPTAPTEPLFELKDPPPIHTHFLGEENSIYFSTLSNVRTIIDSQESDQSEIGYFVKPCQSRGNTKDRTSSDCLWRKTASIIDGDLTRGGTESPILENIEKFELRYFGEEMEGWQKTWRTDERAREETKNRFPQAVQIRLTTNDKNPDSKKKYSMVLVAALRFPNNAPKDQKQQQELQPNEDVAPPPSDQ